MISLLSHRAVALLAVMAAAAAIALSTIGAGAALSLDDFESRLKDAGYKVTPDTAGVGYEGIKQQGTKLVIEKDGKTTTVVLVAYKSLADLKAEWNAEAGKAPKPKATTKAFDGKSVYWNNDSVLVIDAGAGHGSTVGSLFLGRTGDNGTPKPSPTPAPPKTGTGTIGGENNGSSFNPGLLLGGVALLIVGGAAGHLASNRSR